MSGLEGSQIYRAQQETPTDLSGGQVTCLDGVVDGPGARTQQAGGVADVDELGLVGDAFHRCQPTLPGRR